MRLPTITIRQVVAGLPRAGPPQNKLRQPVPAPVPTSVVPLPSRSRPSTAPRFADQIVFRQHPHQIRCAASSGWINTTLRFSRRFQSGTRRSLPEPPHSNDAGPASEGTITSPVEFHAFNSARSRFATDDAEHQPELQLLGDQRMRPFLENDFSESKFLTHPRAKRPPPRGTLSTFIAFLVEQIDGGCSQCGKRAAIFSN